MKDQSVSLLTYSFMNIFMRYCSDILSQKRDIVIILALSRYRRDICDHVEKKEKHLKVV